MKVYIAAKYRRRFELRALASALRAHGVEVTSQWLDNGEEDAEGPQAAAQMDLDDVDRADVVVFIGEPRMSENTGGGRWFELGYAYAKGKQLFIVLAGFGPGDGDLSIGNTPARHETVFTSLPGMVLCDTLDDAVREVISWPRW